MSSAVQHLFDSRGNWIAFRRENFVFDTSGKWIGWLPWGDNDVVDTKGQYLGTIAASDRLYRFGARPYRSYPGYPGYPGYAGYPGYPGFAGYSALPSGASDVEIQAEK